MRPAHLAKALLIVLCVGFGTGCGGGERSDVLILVRAGDPISISIGEYYASARNVPSRRVLELTLSGSGERDEIDVATYEKEIAAPIESYLAREDPADEISILVTTLGVPLRIGHCKKSHPHYPRDCQLAAVDAALAGLGRLRPARGLRAENANPYFADPRSFDRFRRDESEAKLRFLVARLTGLPKRVDTESALPRTVRELMDHPATIDAGPLPLWRVIADAPHSSRAAASAALLNPIHQRLKASGHRVCDGCPSAGDSPPAAGIVVQGNAHSQRELAAGETLSNPGLVIALGDMTDPLDRDSTAGETRADSFQRSLATWFARGARIISTHIMDPSLGGVTRPAIQIQAWISGRTAIEAHFASVPHLGWVNVFIGDPLAVIERPVEWESEDRDGDDVPDDRDNCIDVANPDQRDSNGDQIGNRCDPDVDNDGRVGTSWGQIYPIDARGDLEIIALTARNGPYDPDHDLNGDGQVDESDIALAQLWLFRTPGPSGD